MTQVLCPQCSLQGTQLEISIGCGGVKETSEFVVQSFLCVDTGRGLHLVWSPDPLNNPLPCTDECNDPYAYLYPPPGDDLCSFVDITDPPGLGSLGRRRAQGGTNLQPIQYMVQVRQSGIESFTSRVATVFENSGEGIELNVDLGGTPNIPINLGPDNWEGATVDFGSITLDDYLESVSTVILDDRSDGRVIPGTSGGSSMLYLITPDISGIATVRTCQSPTPTRLTVWSVDELRSGTFDFQSEIGNAADAASAVVAGRLAADDTDQTPFCDENNGLVTASAYCCSAARSNRAVLKGEVAAGNSYLIRVEADGEVNGGTSLQLQLRLEQGRECNRHTHFNSFPPDPLVFPSLTDCLPIANSLLWHQ